jgi:hypothetical protein
MKKDLPVGVVVGVVVVVLALALFFGYRWMSGGPNADVTAQNLAHWKQAAPGPGQKIPGRLPGALSH